MQLRHETALPQGQEMVAANPVGLANVAATSSQVRVLASVALVDGGLFKPAASSASARTLRTRWLKTDTAKTSSAILQHEAARVLRNQQRKDAKRRIVAISGGEHWTSVSERRGWSIRQNQRECSSGRRGPQVPRSNIRELRGDSR